MASPNHTLRSVHGSAAECTESTRVRASDGLFLFAVALLVFVLPALFAGSHTGRLSDVALIGQWAVVAYAGVHLSLLLRRGAPLWFDTMFWAFAYGWIGLAGWAQMTAQQNPYGEGVAAATYERVVLLTFVGFVSYDVGKLLLRPRNLPEADPRGRLVHRTRALGLAAVALVTTPLLVGLLGGVGSFLAPRSERTANLAASGLITDESKVTGGLLLALTNALPLIAFLGVLAVVQHRRHLLRGPHWLLLLAALGALTLFVGNPISNARFWTGTIVLSILFSLRWPNTPRGYRASVSLVLLSLLVVFPYADRYRYADHVAAQRPLGDLFVSKLDYDTAVQMANVLTYVDATGGTHGKQALGVLGFFIPRGMWPGKPGATGSILTQFVGFPQSNVSSPLWVEAYIDGGFVAVAVVFVLLSMAATYAQRFRGRQAGRPVSWAMLLTPVVAAYGVVLLRGSLLSGVGALCVLVGLSWLVTAPARTVDVGEDMKAEPPSKPGTALRTRSATTVRRVDGPAQPR